MEPQSDRASRRGTLLVLALMAALLLLAAGAWWWLRVASAKPRSGSPTIVGVGAASGRGRDARANSAADDASAGHGGSLTSADALSARRAAETFDPLATPAPSEIDGVEREGKALFWGRVLAPDGSPCAGATLWHDGVISGTSDEQGHYRLVVAQRTWDSGRTSNQGFEHWLHARKEGVGVTQAWCGRCSGRCDLRLDPGYAVAGRVVARGSGAPLSGIVVEYHLPLVAPTGALRRLLPLRTVSDEAGAFRFQTLMGSRFALRASGAEWASDGWFEFDVDPKRGRDRLDFELEPRLIAKGWFTPWPPLGFPPAAALDARVVALAAGGQAIADEPDATRVADDGSFALRFAATGTLELRLQVADDSPWSCRIDLPWEPTPVDLGRIELPAPARVTGRVALPAELLELGFEFVVVQPTLAAPRIVRVALDAQGRFTSPPLANGGFLHGVVLGDELAIAGTLANFAPRSGIAVGDGEAQPPLAAGETRDLGTLAPPGPLLAGRLTLADGSAAFNAIVELAWDVEDAGDSFATLADAAGRYVIGRRLGFEPEELAAIAKGNGRIVAHHHAERGRSQPLPALTAGGSMRVDVALDRGAAASGRVVDAQGAPLAGARFLFFPVGWTGGRSQERVAWSDAEGRFKVAGLAPAGYFVIRDLLEGDGEEGTSMESFGLFGQFTAPASDLELRPLQGDREE